MKHPVISSREMNFPLIRIASFEEILSKVDSMSDEQRDEYIKGFVQEHGVMDTMRFIQQLLLNIAKSPKTAAFGDQGWKENQPQDSSPSQLKHKLNNAGDWGYFLAFLLMLGTAGASDMGSDWKQLIRGFAMMSGAAFLGWALKKISAYVK